MRTLSGGARHFVEKQHLREDPIPPLHLHALKINNRTLRTTPYPDLCSNEQSALSTGRKSALLAIFACAGIAPVASLPPPRFHRLASLASPPSPRLPRLVFLDSTRSSRRRPSRWCASVAAQPCHRATTRARATARAAGRADVRGDATKPAPVPTSQRVPTPPPEPTPEPMPADAPADATAQATADATAQATADAARKPPHKPPLPPPTEPTNASVSSARGQLPPEPCCRHLAEAAPLTPPEPRLYSSRCDHPVFLNTLPRVGPCSTRAGYVSGGSPY